MESSRDPSQKPLKQTAASPEKKPRAEESISDIKFIPPQDLEAALAKELQSTTSKNSEEITEKAVESALEDLEELTSEELEAAISKELRLSKKEFKKALESDSSETGIILPEELEKAISQELNTTSPKEFDGSITDIFYISPDQLEKALAQELEKIPPQAPPKIPPEIEEKLPEEIVTASGKRRKVLSYDLLQSDSSEEISINAFPSQLPPPSTSPSPQASPPPSSPSPDTKRRFKPNIPPPYIASHPPGQNPRIPFKINTPTPASSPTPASAPAPTPAPAPFFSYPVLEDDSRDPKHGEKVGEYQVIRKMGIGGMRGLFKCVAPQGKMEVFLRLFPSRIFQSPEMRLWFQQETEGLLLLKNPHIVRTLDSAYDPKRKCVFLVTETLEGRDLDEMLDDFQKIPPDDVLYYLDQIAEALQEAHEKKILHNDLKPANLWITPEKHAIIMNFGVSTILENCKKQMESQLYSQNENNPVGGLVGTPFYLPPERIDGAEPDSRSDLYSLGMVLYHLLTGSPPFRGKSIIEILNSQKYEHPLSLSAQIPSCPEGLQKIFNKLTHKEPDSRFQSAAELLKTLREFHPPSPRRSLPASLNLFLETRHPDPFHLGGHKSVPPSPADSPQALPSPTSTPSPAPEESPQGDSSKKGKKKFWFF
jgi:serine/threonine protein kinase